MVSDTWFSEIESTIFTILQYILVDKSDAPYPSLKCTTSNKNESVEGVATFPTLYIHMLQPVAIGDDLTNETINAVRATFELQVFSNKSETECRKIMNACILEMKKLHFNTPLLADPQSSNGVYYAIARFSRVIASGDVELVEKVD